MSSQKTTGHRKKDKSSSYVDLPGRETDLDKQGLAGPVVCRAPHLGTAPCIWKWSGQGIEFPWGCSQLLSWKEAKGNSTGGQRGAGWESSSSQHLF